LPTDLNEDPPLCKIPGNSEFLLTNTVGKAFALLSECQESDTLADSESNSNTRTKKL